MREHRVPSSWSEDGDSVPVFCGDGRFFAVTDAVRDALHPEQALWQVEDVCHRTLQPLPGGRSVWAATASGWGGCLTLQLLSADGKHGPAREFWGAWAIDWSPDCSRILLGQQSGVHVVDTDSGTSIGFLHGARSTCMWLDNDRLLSLGYGGELELIGIPTQVIATLDLPCMWGVIAKAPGGRRAAVVTHDRVIVVRVGCE